MIALLIDVQSFPNLSFVFLRKPPRINRLATKNGGTAENAHRLRDRTREEL